MMSREKVRSFVESSFVQNGIIAAICLNALQLGFETTPFCIGTVKDISDYIDYAFVLLFALEAVLKIYAWRGEYFKSGWNIFDFLIVFFSLFQTMHGILILRQQKISVPFTVLRLFRALRVLRASRLFSRIPGMRILVNSLFRALPRMCSLMLLLVIFFYIYAVMITQIFGKENPEICGNLLSSFYYLFQLMTLEGWQDTIGKCESPYAPLLLIPFMLIASYIFLNLIVGIIVEAMQNCTEEEKKKSVEGKDPLEEKLDCLMEQVAQMKKLLNRQSASDKTSSETLNSEASSAKR